VVLVGYGRVGKRIAEELTRAAAVHFVVAEQNREVVETCAGATSRRWPATRPIRRC
jgi:Trk K+ transport system NAD-binding subunit